MAASVDITVASSAALMDGFAQVLDSNGDGIVDLNEADEQKESVLLTKNQTLAANALASLSIAQQQQQSVLSLLYGMTGTTSLPQIREVLALGIPGDPGAIAREVLGRRFTQFNAGRRDRHLKEMAQPDSARIRARYDPFYTHVLRGPGRREIGHGKLAWRAVPGSYRYALQISRSPLFEPNIISDDNRRKTSAKLGLKGEGIYYWQVAAIDREGARGPWNKPRGLPCCQREAP